MNLRAALVLAASSVALFGSCNGQPAFSSYAGREYILKVPAGAAASRPMPLVIAMHGYGSDAPELEDAFGLDPLADNLGFFVVYPRGLVDPGGSRFFNATDACCNFYHLDVDDVSFIDSLIDHIEAEYAIDPTRIYAVGYSNGGFMSFRLACDLAPRIAAIVSLEGAMWNDPSRCEPASPVAVLEVHGSADTTISPDGGVGVDGYPGYVYPSVAQTMLDWERFNGCTSSTTSGMSPGEIDGEATGPVEVERGEGCKTAVLHWTIPGGTHDVDITSAWPASIAGFLLAQTKEEPALPTTAR